MQTESERKKSQRERTAKHREKMKARSVEDALANEQKRFDQFNTWRSANRLVFPGEVDAHINAETMEAALQVAREFLIALNQPDIQPGECLLGAERRSVAAWAEAGCPLLNRNTLRLDMSVASVDDGCVFDSDTKWIPLPGSDQPIDVATLAVIERPAVEAAPAVDTPAIVEEFAEFDAQQLAVRESPLYKAQVNGCSALSRIQCEKNLQRETERELRLGVGYAYAVDSNI